MVFYFDTSALAKLIIAESESRALREWIEGSEVQIFTSDSARAELPRAGLRGNAKGHELARQLLDSAVLFPMTTAMLDAAGRTAPPALRTLDAIHLEAALSLGDALDGIVTYDDRLAEAARLHGIPVVSPT